MDASPALNNPAGLPAHLVSGPAGSLYSLDAASKQITRIDGSGILHIVAENKDVHDGAPAAQARFSQPQAALADANGEIYIADTMNHRVRKIGRDGKIVTVAGNGRNSGPGSVPNPRALAFDPQGGLLIAAGNWVRRWSPDGLLTAVAGGDLQGNSGDGGPATQALLTTPNALAFDAGGNLYIADGYNHVVRCVSSDGVISSVVGGSKAPETGALNYPAALAFDSQSNLLIADSAANRVLRYSPGKTLVTIGGNGSNLATFIIGREAVMPATGIGIPFLTSLAVDNQGNIFVSSTGLNWISPDGMLHKTQYDAFGISVDRDGSLLVTDAIGRLNRFTPLR
jgi:sugar lactone lactonase YvrE